MSGAFTSSQPTQHGRGCAKSSATGSVLQSTLAGTSPISFHEIALVPRKGASLGFLAHGGDADRLHFIWCTIGTALLPLSTPGFQRSIGAPFERLPARSIIVSAASCAGRARSA